MSSEKLILSFATNPNTDQADTTLNNGGTLTIGATTLTVNTLPTGVTAAQFRIKIDDEIIIVGAIGGAGNKDWSSLTRGAEGTTAASHADGSNVYIVVTPAGLDQWRIDSLGLGRNEFYWPPPVNVADALDLDAAAQWWRKVGTPTGGIPYKTATAESIAPTYGEKLIKCVSAASGDGLKTTWTYANERRVKSGQYMAVLCAVYLVTAARTVTISLVTSTPTTIASATVTTTGSWQLVALEPGTTALDGTSVDFKATLNGTGTFYVVPLGALISVTPSPRALPLDNRGFDFCWRDGVQIVSLTGASDPNTWTDFDLTSNTSALATIGLISCYGAEGAHEYGLYVRRNGSSEAASSLNEKVHIRPNTTMTNTSPVVLDDAQIAEYNLDRISGAGTLDTGEISCCGYWEWA